MIGQIGTMSSESSRPKFILTLFQLIAPLKPLHVNELEGHAWCGHIKIQHILVLKHNV